MRCCVQAMMQVFRLCQWRPIIPGLLNHPRPQSTLLLRCILIWLKSDLYLCSNCKMYLPAWDFSQFLCLARASQAHGMQYNGPASCQIGCQVGLLCMSFWIEIQGCFCQSACAYLLLLVIRRPNILHACVM